jgi:CheY-like chemotaxis protein
MAEGKAMVRLTVVNDNSELLDLLGEILEGQQYVTTLIENVQVDLRQQICRSEPDLLMIDLRHGNDACHGWDIVRELRGTAGCEDLPVLLCSADIQTLNELEPELRRAAGVVALRLPFEIDELLQSIRRLIGTREAPGCS